MGAASMHLRVWEIQLRWNLLRREMMKAHLRGKVMVLAARAESLLDR